MPLSVQACSPRDITMTLAGMCEILSLVASPWAAGALASTGFASAFTASTFIASAFGASDAAGIERDGSDIEGSDISGSDTRGSDTAAALASALEAVVGSPGVSVDWDAPKSREPCSPVDSLMVKSP